MRHGWQMCHLLIDFFGDTGKVEAKKLLDRRAFEKNRLLGSFNGEYRELARLVHLHRFCRSRRQVPAADAQVFRFCPAGSLDELMLREEAFHMGTGNNGLTRIAEAGIVPSWLMQKYLNKWISSSYDLFGTDSSSSAQWAYTWGLKGRYDEPANPHAANMEDLNDYNRHLYRDECVTLVKRISAAQKGNGTPLYCPDIKFHRNIGKWKHQYFHPQTGQPMEEKEYLEQLRQLDAQCC